MTTAVHTLIESSTFFQFHCRCVGSVAYVPLQCVVIVSGVCVCVCVSLHLSFQSAVIVVMGMEESHALLGGCRSFQEMRNDNEGNR